MSRCWICGEDDADCVVTVKIVPCSPLEDVTSKDVSAHEQCFIKAGGVKHE